MTNEKSIDITPEMIKAAMRELDGWENEHDTREDAVIRIIQTALKLCPSNFLTKAKNSKVRSQES